MILHLMKAMSVVARHGSFDRLLVGADRRAARSPTTRRARRSRPTFQIKCGAALVICLAALASACSYSHIGSTSATFSRVPPALGADAVPAPGGPLVLKINRHLDTVMRGPDTDEDQLLVLEVRDFRLNQRLAIPSEDVTAEFTATRFGPRSTGNSFSGFLILRKVGAKQVVAYLHLDVTASTADARYVQTAKFRGEHKFFREAGHD